ncbi:MAG: chromate transporter [Tissierellaceae bacterium]|nr:chromate transporter [Tissierellaceae bacterium]
MILEMFTSFFKIGAFTFGGGYAMIPIIQQEVVDKKKWIDENEFLDALAVAQGSPGPVAVNTSIYVGYRVLGLPGALAAILGTVLPSFLIMLFIAIFFYQYRDNAVIDKVFLGIRPAIVALILSAVYKLMKGSKFGYKRLLISLGALLAIVFLNISPIFMVIVGAVGAVVYNKYKAN